MPHTPPIQESSSQEITMYSWDFSCPICSSRNLNLIKGTHGDWQRDYECGNCKSTFTYNEGDKMGGQFDMITIIKNTKNEPTRE